MEPPPAALPDSVVQAIERGRETAEALIMHRDALFTHMRAIAMVPGVGYVGLQACVAGVLLAIHYEHEKASPHAD